MARAFCSPGTACRATATRVLLCLHEPTKTRLTGSSNSSKLRRLRLPARMARKVEAVGYAAEAGRYFQSPSGRGWGVAHIKIFGQSSVGVSLWESLESGFAAFVSSRLHLFIQVQRDLDMGSLSSLNW